MLCCRRNFTFSNEQFVSTMVDAYPHAAGFSELVHTVGHGSSCVEPFRIRDGAESAYLRVVLIDRFNINSLEE